MAPRLPESVAGLRNALSPCFCTSTKQLSKYQVRYATAIRRPKRPWTFTQLVTLSDGSTYTQRTTSPVPVLVSAKDRLNHPLWNPSLQSLKNREEDEAGRLAAFRERYGMGFESDNPKVRKAAAIAAEKSDQRRGTLDDQVRSALADTLPADGEGILTPEPSGGDQSSNQAAAATSPIQVLPDAEVARQEKASAKASRLSQGADDGGLMDLISSYSALPRNLAANAFKSSPSKTERGLGEKDSKQSTPTVVGKGPKSK